MNDLNNKLELNYFFRAVLFSLILLSALSSGCKEDHPDKTDFAVFDSTEVKNTTFEPRTYCFECEKDLKFTARIEEEGAWLFLPGRTVLLNPVPMDPDNRFSAEDIEFVIKDNSADLMIGYALYENCINNSEEAVWEAAKLNGADFRAAGNEPGWILEIYEQSRIEFLHNYGTEKYSLSIIEIQVDSLLQQTVYSAGGDGIEMTMILANQSCSDTMIDKTYPTTVKIEFNGEKLHGCGKALH